MTFSFTAGIGGVFNLLGKLTVCILNTTIAYLMIDYLPEIHGEVNSPIGPMAIVFVISFIISHLFMSMYTTTATCMLHCLFADVDICKTMGYDEM